MDLRAEFLSNGFTTDPTNSKLKALSFRGNRIAKSFSGEFLWSLEVTRLIFRRQFLIQFFTPKMATQPTLTLNNSRKKNFPDMRLGAIERGTLNVLRISRGRKSLGRFKPRSKMPKIPPLAIFGAERRKFLTKFQNSKEFFHCCYKFLYLCWKSGDRSLRKLILFFLSKKDG